MNLTLRVTDQGVERVIEDGVDQIYVVFELVDEAGNVVEEKRLGFAADSDADLIKAQLQIYLDNFQSEVDKAPAQAVQDQAAMTAQETVESLQDLQITSTITEEE